MKHLAAILILWAAQASAQTNLAGFSVKAITNISGVVVSNVTVSKIDRDSVCYTFSDGVGGGRILFENMAESERPLFGYDAAKAAKAKAERAKAYAQMQAQLSPRPERNVSYRKLG